MKHERRDMGHSDCSVCRVFRTVPAYGGTAPAPPLPPPWRRAWTFLKAIVRHALNGFRKAAPAVKAQRMALCLACDLILPDGRCGNCTCPANTKAGWESERCPLGKW